MDPPEYFQSTVNTVYLLHVNISVCLEDLMGDYINLQSPLYHDMKYFHPSQLWSCKTSLSLTCSAIGLSNNFLLSVLDQFRPLKKPKDPQAKYSQTLLNTSSTVFLFSDFPKSLSIINHLIVTESFIGFFMEQRKLISISWVAIFYTSLKQNRQIISKQNCNRIKTQNWSKPTNM